MKTVKFQLETLTCPSCIKKIEKALNRESGVEEVKVLFQSSKVKVQFNEEVVSQDHLRSVVERLGYSVLKAS